MNKSNNNDFRIVTQVSNDCRKKLKILAIQKETTLPIMVKEILEKAMNKKQIGEIELQE